VRNFKHIVSSQFTTGRFLRNFLHVHSFQESLNESFSTASSSRQLLFAILLSAITTRSLCRKGLFHSRGRISVLIQKSISDFIVWRTGSDAAVGDSVIFTTIPAPGTFLWGTPFQLMNN
jgi:hypothetical protein